MIGHEEVVQLLTEETISYHNDLGFEGMDFSCGKFGQLVNISIKSEVREISKIEHFLIIAKIGKQIRRDCRVVEEDYLAHPIY